MSPEKGFSWKAEKDYAVSVKVERAKTMALAGSNSDFKLKHPDWIRDAQSKNYTKLVTDVTVKTRKYQDNAQRRRDKRAGKN